MARIETENGDTFEIAEATRDGEESGVHFEIDQHTMKENPVTTSTVIALGDDRDTKFTVQTVPTSTGTCSHGHDSCGRPGVLAVRNTIDQQRPTENSTLRVTLCADHQDDAARMHALWVADAREMQDPVKRAEFLASAGVTD